MRIQNLERLQNHGNIQGRQQVLEILEAGLQAADPYYNTLRLIRIENGALLVGDPAFEPIGDPRAGVSRYPLDKLGRIFVFGAGKGIQQIAKGLEEALGDLLTGGHIILKHGDPDVLKKISVTWGGHPIPDEHCVEGCRKIVSMIEEADLQPEDLVFTIVGNGVSSLLTLPAPGLSLESVKKVTRILQIEKGATTRDLNYIRNEIDQLKGGRITRLLRPAQMVHLLSVDCNYGVTAFVGYRGLTEGNVWLHSLPDCTSKERAIQALHQLDAWDLMDKEVQDHLLNMTPEQEALKKPEFEAMNCRIFGMMPDPLGVEPAVKKKCEEMGLPCHTVCKAHFLESAEAGKFTAGIAKLIAAENQPFEAPCVLLITGEKIVKVGANGGVGGRNQEFCISAALQIANQDRIVIASADTDGTDGPGGYFCEEAKALGVAALAGGIVDGFTIREAEHRGVDLREALKTHATSKALWDLDSGIWTSQNISVQDIVVVLIQEPTSHQ